MDLYLNFTPSEVKKAFQKSLSLSRFALFVSFENLCKTYSGVIKNSFKNLIYFFYSWALASGKSLELFTIKPFLYASAAIVQSFSHTLD